jgi:hypothetical protein
MSTDIEGISGFAEWDNWADNFPAGICKRDRMRRIYTREVNAAVEGGASGVVIFDGHGPANHNDNLLIEDLHPEAELIIGVNALTPGPIRRFAPLSGLSQPVQAGPGVHHGAEGHGVVTQAGQYDPGVL